MILFEDFILRPLAAGLIIAAVTGPLGCFVVWRRMAYFGDTMAHGALLGVAIGLLGEVPVLGAVVAVGLILSLFLSGLVRRGRHSADTLLGIFSHSTLALGLVILGTAETLRVDLPSILFGDILAVTDGDLVWIGINAGIILLVLAAAWRSLLLATISDDIARAEGVRVDGLGFLLMALIALTVSIAMKIVGVLLVTALLIIPAAAARNWARTPESMAALAAALGMVAVCGGVSLSAYMDAPTGPAIVVAAAILFGLGLVFRRGRAYLAKE